jgi:hypothetical protein
MTLDEWEAQMRAEGKWDEFLARREAKEKELADRSARLRVEAEPLLADLNAAGWKVESVWDLVNTSANYAEVIPVLLKHLLFPYSDRTREGIARSLAVPDARGAWSTLVEEYRKAPLGVGTIAPGETKEFRLGAKDGLACALAATATKEVMDELVSLAKDRSLGPSRLLLLSALKKSKSEAAKSALNELASDPDLEKEIASWRRRRT